MNRISFSGKMTAGKTISAEYLADNFGYQRLRFANPIYEIMNLFTTVYQTEDFYEFDQRLSSKLEEIFPNDLQSFVQAYQNLAVDLYQEFLPIGKDMKFKDPNYRSMMQKIGTEKMRSVRSDVWIQCMIRTIASQPETDIAIDDTRFLDEYNALKQIGFVMVRLEIEPLVQKERMLKLYGSYDQAALQHVSEVELDQTQFDICIDANVSKQEMFDAIVKKAIRR